MLFWTIQTILISFTLIFLVHHLIQFFTNTLTVPKIKDLVYSPTKKYETIYEILSKKNEKNDSTTPIDWLPSFEKQEIQKPKDSMKDELKNFLKSQLNPESNQGSTPLDSISYYQFK